MRPPIRPVVAAALAALIVVAVAAAAMSAGSHQDEHGAHGDQLSAPSEPVQHTEHDASEQQPHTAHAEPTPRTRTPARRLVLSTRRNLERWRSVEAAVANGFRSIGDGRTGYEHYVNWSWVDDGTILSARRPESLVYRVDGKRPRLVSAMYILERGATMNDVPDLGDARAVWHRHTDLCWRDRRVVGLHIGGRCVPDGRLRVTPPMIHVWRTAHPCGPFAGLDLRGRQCPAGGHDHGG